MTGMGRIQRIGTNSKEEVFKNKGGTSSFESGGKDFKQSFLSFLMDSSLKSTVGD